MSCNNLMITSAIICFSQTSAFPTIRRHATKSIHCGPTNACNMHLHHHAPFISSGKRRRYFEISMASADDGVSESNSESKVNDDDVLFPRPSLQHSNDEDFAVDRSSIDWEPILDVQYEDMDDFLDTLDYPGDEYVDIDDDTMLQDFDKETLLEILGFGKLTQIFSTKLTFLFKYSKYLI